MLEQQEQWSEAIVAYQKVRDLNPTFVPALIRAGSIYRRLKKYQLGIDCYHQALEIAPKSSSIEDMAYKGYQETIKTHPNLSPNLYHRLGKLLRSKSRFTEAIAAYQQAINLDPQFRAPYIDIQYTPIAAEQLEQLIEFYRDIVTKHSDISIAWGNLGDALTQKGEITKAIDCYSTSSYQQAVNRYPQLAKLTWKERQESGPDFIIAGGAKCGTSSIYNYLSHHPQILLSHKKELDFFWRDFDKGIDWYLSHFPSITDTSDFITGEAAPNYLRFPKVATRIKEYFPQVKIIILLRNPIDRAVSWHYHQVNHGMTTGNFADALVVEMEQLKQFSESDLTNIGFRNPDNLLCSLYIYKIKAWIEILGREQFLILKSEEFYNNPGEVMERVYAFLGLPNHLQTKYLKVNAGSYNPISPDIRKTLAEYFAPYNQQLEEYLGMKFDWS